MKRLGAPAFVACLVLMAPTDAAAQASCNPVPGLTTCLPSDNLWPHARGPFSWVAPASAAESGTLSLGAVTSWIHRPIGLVRSSVDSSGATNFVVEDAVTIHLLASIGLNDRLSFDVATPFTAYQTGAGVGFVTGSTEALPRSAVGELRFGPSVTVLRQGAMDVAARLQLAAPTGSPKGFSRFPGITFAPGVSASYRFDRWVVGADLEARLRESVELGDAVVGSQIKSAVGATYELLDEKRLSVSAELYALLGLAAQYSLGPNATGEDDTGGPHIPAEWLVSFSSGQLLGGKLFARLGVGSALPTSATSDVTAPALRAVGTLSFVP